MKKPIQTFWEETIRLIVLRIIIWVGLGSIVEYYLTTFTSHTIPFKIAEGALFAILMAFIDDPGIISSYHKAKSESSSIAQIESQTHD